jgi:hypothetical protein
MLKASRRREGCLISVIVPTRSVRRLAGRAVPFGLSLALGLVLGLAPPFPTGLSQAPLDPLVSLHDAYVIDAAHESGGVPEEGDRFGDALAAGDVTGDGVADLMVGAPQATHTAGLPVGLLFPLQGSAAGPSQGRLDMRDQTDAGGVEMAGDEFGGGLAVGDFDGDGIADVAVGAPGKTVNAQARAGVVYILKGQMFSLLGVQTLTQEQGGETSEAQDAFGQVLITGDFNHDGFADLVVGVPGEDLTGHTDAGAIVLFRGSAAGLGSPLVFTEASAGLSIATGDRFGAALAAGDFDGDGDDDLAVGVPGRSVGGAAGAGLVVTFRGIPAGLGAGPSVTQELALETSEAGDGFGSALAAADLNGDGRKDLVIGTPNEDHGGANDTGYLCAVVGGVSAFSALSCFGEASAGIAEESGAHFGTAVAAGDFNGDGRADIVAGAPGSALGGAAAAGALFLYASTPAGPQYRQKILQQDVGDAGAVNEQFGQRLVVADFDGDGTADVAAAAPLDEVGGVHGGSVVFLPGLTPVSRLKSGPVLGDPGPDRMRVWARADRAASLAVEYKPSGAAWPGTVSAAVNTDASGDFAGTIALTGLQPASAYDYRLRLDGQPTTDEWTFRTLGAVGPGTVTTFALGADLKWGLDPFDIFNPLHAHDPDVMLYLGDQIYADEPVAIAPDVAAYSRKYREVWGERFLAPFLSGVPALMMWDDHEIFDNWDSGTADPYTAARAAFDIYQGSHNPPPRLAGGISFEARAGDAAFYFLDTRTFRSPEDAPDDTSKTMIGSSQRADLEQWLLASTARFKFIASSIMWNDHGTTGNDSWAGYRTERQEIFQFIRSHHLCGVLLLSGDQHWTGVFRLADVAPHYLYELSPTPLGNSRRNKTTDTGADILFTYDANKVFGLVTADSRTEPATVTWEVHDPFDQVIYQQTIPWSGLCPDSDGDTFLDDVDCAPENPAAWARPGEVQIDWSGPGPLVWAPPANAGGTTAPVYDVLESPDASDFSGGQASCLLTGSTSNSYVESVSPPVGGARFYLVRSRNVCGGTLGEDSAGVERPGRSCP